MSLSLNIARRYLFGKKSTNAINLITGISIIGITIGTSALVIILSVFNGFEGLLSGLFDAFNPDLKIEAVEGKFFEIDSLAFEALQGVKGVAAVSRTLEEVALFEYKEVQETGIVKGVDRAYAGVTGIDTLVVNGRYRLAGDPRSYGVVGAGMRNKLSINTEDRLSPVTVYMPLKKRVFPGAKEFKFKELYPAGVFSVQSDNDFKYVLAPYAFVEDLIDRPGGISALEIRLDTGASEDNVRKAIADVLPDNLRVKNRYEQDAAFLRIMNIEKWISFLITGLTMILIAFNLVGALWMIVLDKRKDIAILKSLGYTSADIRRLFMQLGILVTGIGIVFGFIVALVIVYLQMRFGLVGVPDGFMIKAYPVELRFTDFCIVALTVLIIGYLAAILPSLKAARSEIVLRAQ